MNKYLMMTASALLASTAVHTSASARTTRIGFSGFCDGYQFSTKDGVLYVARHLYTGCGVTSASPLEVTAAQRNRSSSYKKFLVTGPAGSSYLVFGYIFQLPIKNGNQWAGFAATNSASIWEYNAGTYYTGYAHTKGTRGHLKSSTWDAKQQASERTKKMSKLDHPADFRFLRRIASGK